MADEAEAAPGHESGHAAVPGAIGFSWERYVLAFVDEHGGWAALTDALIRRGAHADVPTDPQVVEKGLRRLARRGTKTGGQYGQWMIRHLGVPSSLERWARWMGQFHSRFADLPSSLRAEQLAAWDRPPISESRAAAWIHLGISSVALRQRDDTLAASRIELAERTATRAGVACRIEVALLRAKLWTDADRRDEAEALFDAVERALPDPELGDDDRRCYHARLVGQRAYHLTRPRPGAHLEPTSDELRRAQALFESIADAPFLPFVAFRKANGLAYCRWQLGDVAAGIAHARLAEQHAGDGGLVRFRIMALNLLARMLPAEDGAAVRARAERLAQLLEDEDLLRRVQGRWGA